MGSVILTNSQREFLASYSTKRFYSRMESFWGDKINTKLELVLPNGEMIDVMYSDIKFVDHGVYPGAYCLCGQGIRYEFWIDCGTLVGNGRLGPIGSTCITTLTGLSGQVVKDVLKGSGEVSREIREVTILLEQYGVFEQWAQIFKLDEKGEALSQVPEAQDFIEHRLPLPSRLASLVGRVHRGLITQVDKLPALPYIVKAEKLLTCSELASLAFSEILDDILSKGRLRGLTIAQQRLLEKMVKRFEDDDQLLALEAVVFLHNQLQVCDDFVSSLYRNGTKYGLTSSQIDCILGRNSRKSLVLSYKKNIEQYPDELPWYNDFVLRFGGSNEVYYQKNIAGG